MGLFKSNRERATQRNLQVKRAIRAITKNMSNNEKQLAQYREKAKRAKQIGDTAQLSVIKAAMSRTLSLSRTQERQILMIETSMQIKDQAESVSVFADALKAVSKAIGTTFKAVDIDMSIEEYEDAMTKADTLADQMDMFLDVASGASTGVGDDGLVSEEEIDAMIEDDAVESEASHTDERIQAGLDRVRKGLKNE